MERGRWWIGKERWRKNSCWGKGGEGKVREGLGESKGRGGKWRGKYVKKRMC